MNTWRAHSGHLALPTLALVAGLSVATRAVWAASVSGALPLWAGCLLMIALDYLWFTPMHEAAHGNVGGSKRLAWVDSAAGWLSSLPFLGAYPAFRAVHLRHHGTVNRPEDPDAWVRGSSVLSVALRCLSILPHYYYVVFTRLGRERRGLSGLSALGLLATAALTGLAAWQGLLAELLLLWIVPAWLSTGLLALVLDWLPHHPHSSTERLTNTRFILAGPWLTVLMMGHDLHPIHHLWPRVPFYRYPTVYRETAAQLRAQGVPEWRRP